MKIYQALQNLLVGDKQTANHFGMVEVTFNAINKIQHFIQIHQSVQKLHPPQKSKRPPFWNGRTHGIKTAILKGDHV
jgi:hypothetical protein